MLRVLVSVSFSINVVALCIVVVLTLNAAILHM